KELEQISQMKSLRLMNILVEFLKNNTGAVVCTFLGGYIGSEFKELGLTNTLLGGIAGNIINKTLPNEINEMLGKVLTEFNLKASPNLGKLMKVTPELIHLYQVQINNKLQ
ncbi:hypothetical protein, partial [Peribacillus simplex]|uniref:hypothetical protein n=1 Tax=Peribacillus simplex TaxID=1478 RepID=UPI00148595D3